MKKENWIWIACGVSLLLSIAALLVAICRSEPMQVEWASFLVGALSLLVTVLAGLNIYTLVDFRRKERLVDEKINLITESLSNLSKAELSTSAATEYAISFLYYSLMGLKDPLGLEYRYLYHNLVSLSKVSQLGDIETCNAIVKGMLEVIVRPENISMKKINKDHLYVWISQIKKPMDIEGFGELAERIARIKAVL